MCEGCQRAGPGTAGGDGSALSCPLQADTVGASGEAGMPGALRESPQGWAPSALGQTAAPGGMKALGAGWCTAHSSQ